MRIAWFLPLIKRGVTGDCLAMLAFLAQSGSEGYGKAAHIAWLAASKESIRKPNGWLYRAVMEKIREMGLSWD